MSFSERSGLVPARVLQRAQMDLRLRNGLWSAVSTLLERVDLTTLAFSRIAQRGPSVSQELLEHLWVEFLGAARDQFGVSNPYSDFREWFFKADWNRAYDFVEYIAGIVRDQQFRDECNHVLTRECAAYRLVEGRIIELTDEQQLEAIGGAIKMTAAGPVHEHLETAVARLADRPSPDYRNAMKEAISAVETLVNMIAGSSGRPLNEALETIQKRKAIPLHPALDKAWQSIYAYASDEGGVRHGLKGDSNVELGEAVYMVVTCSAFVSYLVELSHRSGIEL